MINKATPTATLAVNNSPRDAMTGRGKAATVGDHGQLGAGRGGEHSDRRRGDADQRGDLCGDGGLRADRHGQLQQLTGQAAGNFVINKATPTATLAVNNSPQTLQRHGHRRRRSAITASSVPGAVANILTGGAATRRTRGRMR